MDMIYAFNYGIPIIMSCIGKSLLGFLEWGYFLCIW